MAKQTHSSTVQTDAVDKPFSKSLLTLVALIPCVSSFAFAVSSPSLPLLTVTKPRPSLLFATYLYHHGEREVDFKPTLESEFRFRNLGDAPVQITKIEQSCGCLHPSIIRPDQMDEGSESQLIEPGGFGAIYAPIATINQKAGPQEYTLNVHYKDPLPRQATLTIKAIFPEKMVTVTPRTLMLSQKTRSSFPLPQLTVSDYRDSPLSVKEIYSSAPFISADLEGNVTSGIQQVSMEEQFGSSTKITGEVAGGIPPGRHHALIAASTNDPEFPAVTVPMVVNGPAYPTGKSARISPEQFRLVASDHPDAARVARLELVVPASWKVDYAESWPEQLNVEYATGAPFGQQQQMIVVEVTLAELPPNNLKNGIIQLICNGGKNLVTAKANFIWP